MLFLYQRPFWERFKNTEFILEKVLGFDLSIGKKFSMSLRTPSQFNILKLQFPTKERIII
jgi:hypothetical protein